MKLRFYDILSHLIPGLMVYFSIMFLWEIPSQWQQFLPAFAFAMAIGFFVNALSSWLEPLYYWSWAGEPGVQLLNGKDIAKVRFYEKEKVAKILQDQYPGESKKALFPIAYREISNAGNEKIQVFNENYGYARSLLTTGLILSVIFLTQYYCLWWVWVITLLLDLMLWQRAKERGFYFAREVLSTYLGENQKS